VRRLESENRVAREELERALHSKTRRLVVVATHPLWAIRAATSWFVGRAHIRTLRATWAEFRTVRISLSSVAMSAHLDGEKTADSAPPRWSSELRISGEVHEGLLCSANSRFTFRTPVKSSVRLRAKCAVLPDAWDASQHPMEFRVAVRVGSGSDAVERSAMRVLRPASRWSDRHWRSLDLMIPMTAGGETVITLETRSEGFGSAVTAAWGDVCLEWPRSASDRHRLILGATRRIREWGPRGAIAYALGRGRADDQAAAYARWIALNTPDERALRVMRQAIQSLPYQPLISVITPVYNTPPDVLSACLESVRHQIYANWEHCIVDDASTLEATRSVLREHARDPRVRLVTLETNRHVSQASNEALSSATGDYVALLDHDDELAPEALAEVVRALNSNPDADVIYSDEDKLDAHGARCEPYFKPDWSPELFLSYMYICHLTVLRRRLVEEVGGFRTGFEGAQDYDLVLRMMQKTDRIYHVPRVLYHWRKGEGSTAMSPETKPWAHDAGRRALEDYVRRVGLASEVTIGPHPGMYRVWRTVKAEPLVSIVIPTMGVTPTGADLLARCLRSLHKTTWRNFEVIVAADNSPLSETASAALQKLRHSVVAYSQRGSFSFAHKVNEAARHARGEHLLLLNDDVEVLTPGWLSSMLEHSQDPAVGAVGAKLLYPNGRLQHVGILIGVCGVAAHAFHQCHAGTSGYAGSAVVVRNCSAVTGACLMTRRAVFDELGGLAEDLPVDFNDVDFCLRLRSAGYRIVFTPYAQLIHHESASFGNRRQSSVELERMRQKWGEVLDRDPYYSPNLSRLFSDYRIQT
jgi:GT2 family glycosyltransferase